MFDVIKFFKPAYLFDLRPYTTPGTIKSMLIFFAIMIAIGLAAKIFQTAKKLEKFQSKMLEKIISFFIVLGAVGLGLAWLRYERVQILSGRFWLVVWLIIAALWLYPILKYWIKIAPEAKKRSEEKKLFTKYLPGKK